MGRRSETFYHILDISTADCRGRNFKIRALDLPREFWYTMETAQNIRSFYVKVDFAYTCTRSTEPVPIPQLGDVRAEIFLPLTPFTQPLRQSTAETAIR